MAKRTTAEPTPTPPIEHKLTPEAVQRLTATRDRIMRGRVFDDSTAIIRRLRRQRGAASPKA